jgi:hypothetical protein
MAKTINITVPDIGELEKVQNRYRAMEIVE